MGRQRPPLRSVFSTLAFLAVISGTGCHSLDTELSQLFGDDSPAAEETTAPTATANEKYYVEFRESGRKPVLIAMPLSDVTYVQQALEQSGALKKFRRLKIEVYRQLPQGGGHKLPVAFDRNERRVPSGSDYALHPNDRVVVTEDRSTILDDMLENLGAPKIRAGK